MKTFFSESTIPATIYIMNMAKSIPIKTNEARKLQSNKFPKKILFPSNSDTGSMLKNA